ncbi:MAG: hypothetical protein ACRYGB_07515 [Janthinobacterium lividum]
MKIVYSTLKIAVISFLIYKCLFNSFLFLIAGMWIIPFLLLILFAYLCKSFLGEASIIARYFKSFPQSGWKEKLFKFSFKSKISKRLTSETV